MAATRFGDIIRDLRKAKGLNQADLANRASLARYTIFRVKQMERPEVQPLTLANIAQALGVKPEDLIVYWQKANQQHGPAAGVAAMVQQQQHSQASGGNVALVNPE